MQKKYVGARITGKYIVKIELNDDLLLEDNRKRMNESIEKYATEELAEELAKNNKDMTEDELRELLLKNIKEKTEFINSILDGYEIGKFKNVRKSVNEYLLPIHKNKHLTSLIRFALDVRNKKRLKQYGGSEEPYKIPENILRYKDYKDNDAYINKHLNLSDSDSNSE